MQSLDTAPPEGGVAVSEVSKLLAKDYKPTEYERIDIFYKAGRVKRLHCIPTVNAHTIAQHTYGALLIGLHFCETMVGRANPANVMKALLYHDIPEVVTGDIPAPVKRRSETVKHAVMLIEQEFNEKFNIFVELTDVEQRIVKAADSLDLAFNALHEREMGNKTRHIESVFFNALSYARETGLPGVSYFSEALRDDWSKL